MGSACPTWSCGCKHPEILQPQIKLPEQQPKPPSELCPYEKATAHKLTLTQMQYYEKAGRPRSLPQIDKGYKVMATGDCKHLYDYFICCGQPLQNGLPNGDYRLYFSNKFYFQGTFQNGKLLFDPCFFLYPDGTYFEGKAQATFPGFRIQMEKGRVHYPDGCVFTGTFRNNKQHGKECSYYDVNTKTTYYGQWRNDTMHGEIEERENGQLKFKGNYIDGKRQGHGIQHCTNGFILEGKWAADQFNGSGIMTTKKNKYDVVCNDGEVKTCSKQRLPMNTIR